MSTFDYSTTKELQAVKQQLDEYKPNLNRVMRLTITLENEIKRHLEGHRLNECLLISKEIREEIVKLKDRK